MTLAYWCVLAAIFLPYLNTAIAKFQGGFGPKQNHNPREFLETLEGSRKRAHWAQQNGFEVTPAFAAAASVDLSFNYYHITTQLFSRVH